MPRPQILQMPKILTVVVEYEQYLLLKEIALRKEISLSDLMREIINDYLTRHGIKEEGVEKKAIAMSSGINYDKETIAMIDAARLEDILYYMEKDIQKLESCMPLSSTWYNARERVIKAMKDIRALLAKGTIANEKLKKRAYRLIAKAIELTRVEK